MKWIEGCWPDTIPWFVHLWLIWYWLYSIVLSFAVAAKCSQWLFHSSLVQLQSSATWAKQNKYPQPKNVLWRIWWQPVPFMHTSYEANVGTQSSELSRCLKAIWHNIFQLKTSVRITWCTKIWLYERTGGSSNQQKIGREFLSSGLFFHYPQNRLISALFISKGNFVTRVHHNTKIKPKLMRAKWDTAKRSCEISPLGPKYSLQYPF